MTISACLIVRDEAQRLKECLESLQTIADEVIVIDTGSTDRTQAVTKLFTDRIFEFVWRDDYAAARNLALEHAKSNWIFIVDADERLDPKSAELLPSLLKKFDSAKPVLLNAQVITPGYQPVFSKALFPNHLGIRFKGSVHEWPAYQDHWLQGINCPELVLNQLAPEPAKQQTKLKYYARLLEDELKHTKDIYEQAVYYKHLGLGALELGNQDDALDALMKSLEAFKLSGAPRDQLMYHNLLVPLFKLSLSQRNDIQLAEAFARELTTYFPDFGEGWQYLAYCHFWFDRLREAERAYTQALMLNQRTHVPKPVQLRSQFQILLGRARIALLQGNLELGIQILNFLHQRNPQLELSWHLCRAYAMLQALPQAKHWYQIASGTSAPETLTGLLVQLSKIQVWSPKESSCLYSTLCREEYVQ